MSLKLYNSKKIADIFGITSASLNLADLEERNLIPQSTKYKSGALFQKGWKEEQLPHIGERIGFFPKFKQPLSVSVFTTKGGVLKSTVALNLARIAALHNIKTCVVGLDIQGDISSNLGHEMDIAPEDKLEEVIDRLNQTRGLADLFNNQVHLNDLIIPTDLEKLFLIPETPELAALNDSINNINRREFWLKEKVVDKLKKDFELIIMDCSPNWNKLTTNALVASDVLISPLECKINNFRNFKVFRHFLDEFQRDMRINFETIYVPTRYSLNKKLTLEILGWYQSNVTGCTSVGIKEGITGEEASALNKSVIEHAPTSNASRELRNLMREIHERIANSLDHQEHYEYRPPVFKEEVRSEAWH